MLMRLETQVLEIPFKQTFAHTAASRSKTASLLTTATLPNGVTGYGESCPRSYVTGETLKSALVFHNIYKASLSRIDSLPALRGWITDHTHEIDANPAAFCAIELALLDVLARASQQSVEKYLGLPEIRGSFQYTGVIGLGAQSSFNRQVAQYRGLGLRDFKLKISGMLSADCSKLNALREGERIRLDANNRWRDAAAVISYMQAVPVPVFAIEEPLKVRDFEQLTFVSNAIHLPIILDESFGRLEDFDFLLGGQWIINCRISKMGGLLRSLDITEEAQRRKIPVICGAHVGESSLLSRAALTLVNNYPPPPPPPRDSVIAQEGAFSTYLLQKEPFSPAIQFSQGGIFTCDNLRCKEGFGLSSENKL